MVGLVCWLVSCFILVSYQIYICSCQLIWSEFPNSYNQQWCIRKTSKLDPACIWTHLFGDLRGILGHFMVYPIIICCWLNVSYYSVGKCLHKDYIISLLANIPLTHFMPLISFDTPRKQKNRGFLMFSGGIKRDQWHEMG